MRPVRRLRRLLDLAGWALYAATVGGCVLLTIWLAMGGAADAKIRPASGGGASATPTPDGTKANVTLNNLSSTAINAALNTGAGTTLALSSTASAQTASAQAGIPVTVTASDAVAGSSNAGAAAGGSVTITTGAAKRLTSGNANGGNINMVPGAGIGTGTTGKILYPDNTGGSICNTAQTTTCLDFNSNDLGLRFYQSGSYTAELGNNVGFQLASGFMLGFQTGGAGSSNDVLFIRGGTNRVHIITNAADGTTRGDLGLRHLAGGSTAPSVTAGGCTSPSVTGTDLAGEINVGTGCVAQTTVTITFGTAFAAAPYCLVQDRTTGGLSITWVPSTTTLAITDSVALVSSDKYVYHCLGV